MTWFKSTTLAHAVLLALPVLAAQVAVTQLQSDLGYTALSSAVAAEKKKMDSLADNVRTAASKAVND